MADEQPGTGDPLSLDRVSLDVEPRDGLNLKQLYYFHAVATEGGLKRAARKLGLSQGTLSESVRKLEDYLQHSLFDRRPGGGLRLNVQGHRVFEHTQIMFRATRRLVQEFAPQRMQDRWVLEVGLSPNVSRSLTATHLLPLFHLQGAAPRLRLGTHRDLLEDLLEGELDLLISENPPARGDERRVATRVVTDSPFEVYAHPDLADAAGGFPESLVELPFLHYSRGSRYRWQLDEFFFQHGVSPDVIGEVDDVVLLVAAATETRCAVAAPSVVVEERVAGGALVRLGAIDSVHCPVHAHYLATSPTEIVLQALDAISQ